MAWGEAGQLAVQGVAYHDGAVGLLNHARNSKGGRSTAGGVDRHHHVVGVVAVVVLHLVAVNVHARALEQRVDVGRVEGLVGRVGAHAHL